MKPIGAAWMRRVFSVLALAGVAGATSGAWSRAAAETGVAKPKSAARVENEAERRAREKLNADLIETALLIQQKEGELTAIEAKLATLEKQESEKKSVLDRRRDEIGNLLDALLRMGRNPPPVIFTERRDALKVVRTATLLASAFPLLSTEAAELAGDLAKLDELVTATKSERAKIEREKAHLEAKKTRLAGLLADKEKALKTWQPELATVKAEIAGIAKATDDPDQIIARGDKVVASRTGLGEYEREAKDAGPNVPSAAAGAEKGGAPAEGGKAGDEVAMNAPVVLAPSGAVLAPGADRMKPARPFEDAKKNLPLPAQGNRVVGFGEKTQYGGQSKGIVIETRPGAQITSPCDGWIIYSNEFRSYGQLLIINAGDGYHVLLAGLSRVDVQPGQFVLAAEPVGTMSSAPQGGGGQASVPVLYVEFRKDNRPVDPDPWWVPKVQR